MNYQLLLYSSVKQGGGFIADITRAAQGWRRSIRMQGGFWQGSFRISAELPLLQEWFYNRLGAHVQERSGGMVSWAGMVYEMELAAGGVRRRRSLDDMSNAVAVLPANWNTRLSSLSWSTQAQSVARYGRKETLITKYSSATQATAQAARMLEERAYPWPRAVAVGTGNAASLDVTVCGYVFAANWRYIDPQGSYWDGTQSENISAWLKRLADAYAAEYLTTTKISTNTVQHQKMIEAPVRCWDYLQELVEVGDADGDPWRLYVDSGRRLNYEQIDLTPYYWLRHDGLYLSAGGQKVVNPYLLRPGVLRDLQYPQARTEPGSMLADARDILIDEVEVNAAGQANLRTAEYSLTDLLALQDEQRAGELDWWNDYWDKANEADYARRKAEWDALHPGERFPG